MPHDLDTSTYDAQLDAAVAPIREQRKALVAELERIEEDARVLKAMIAQRDRLLRVLDPQEPKPRKSSSTGKALSERSPRIDELLDWLRATVNGEVFYATGLLAREDFHVFASQSQVSKALAVLHERGAIRLDSRGIGGRKNFKLVTPDG